MAATTSEILSLEEINYKSPSKLKALGVILLALFLLFVGFLNFYPIGEEVRKQLKTAMQGSNCNVDYNELSLQVVLGKLMVTDLVLPASCFNREGQPITLSHLTINYHLISFLPFGLPFRIDTEVAGQALSFYYVLGFGEHTVRIKDQKISLTKIMPLIAPEVKIKGNVVVDLNMKTNNQGVMNSMTLQAESKDFELPAQSIQSVFTLPNLKIGELRLDAHSDTPPRIVIDKMVTGNTSSPIRSELKGYIDLQQGNVALSPISITGQVAFDKTISDTIPLDLFMGSFPIIDGFYQLKLGGTLGRPVGSAP